MLQSLGMFLPIMRFFHFYDKNIDIYTAQWDIPFPASLCAPLSAQYVCLSATLTKKQSNRYLTSKDTQNHVIKRTPSTEREPFRSGDTTMFPRRVSVCSDERCILIKISQGAVVHVRNLGRHTCSKTICYMNCKVIWRWDLFTVGFLEENKIRNEYQFIWEKFYANPDEVILSWFLSTCLEKLP